MRPSKPVPDGYVKLCFTDPRTFPPELFMFAEIESHGVARQFVKIAGQGVVPEGPDVYRIRFPNGLDKMYPMSEIHRIDLKRNSDAYMEAKKVYDSFIPGNSD